MKAFNFMLSACVAAVAFTSCTKEDLPEIETRMKTVEVSLENAVYSATRGLAGNKINHGDPVVVDNLKIFLLDHAGKEYPAKVSDGTLPAKSYWTAAELASSGLNAQFHYVDHGCTRIVAVANLGDPDMTFEELQANQALGIDNEQDATSLSLYADAELKRKGNDQHQDQNAADGTTYVSDVYEANLTLRPRISRFEVDGFRVAFNATPKYNEIKITDMLFDHYAKTTSLITGIEGTSYEEHISDLTSQSIVYNWFNNSTKPAAWYWDALADVTITPATPAVATASPLAYHIFSGNVVPRLVLKLIVDGQPAYLYSRGFYSATEMENGKPKLIDEFKEGYIYRMSAEGVVDGTDGFIPIDEDDIDPMDRCIEISVVVEPWVVELVYPEF